MEIIDFKLMLQLMILVCIGLKLILFNKKCSLSSFPSWRILCIGYNEPEYRKCYGSGSDMWFNLFLAPGSALLLYLLYLIEVIFLEFFLLSALSQWAISPFNVPLNLFFWGAGPWFSASFSLASPSPIPSSLRPRKQNMLTC